MVCLMRRSHSMKPMMHSTARPCRKMRSPASGVAAELGSVWVLGPLVTFVLDKFGFLLTIGKFRQRPLRSRADRRPFMFARLEARHAGHRDHGGIVGAKLDARVEDLRRPAAPPLPPCVLASSGSRPRRRPPPARRNRFAPAHAASWRPASRRWPAARRRRCRHAWLHRARRPRRAPSRPARRRFSIRRS